MHGQIFVKSVIGQGSTFYFRIPVELPPVHRPSVRNPNSNGNSISNGKAVQGLAISIPNGNEKPVNNTTPRSPIGPVRRIT